MAFFKQNKSATKRSFLARLGRDAAGNVFAMTAAAVVPMIGVVGGAIDASRMYMTRARLQAACDSAVLAGRRSMPALTLDTASQNRANAMFDFNFQNADFQTTSTARNFTADSTGRVNGTASTQIPMTLMKVFGIQSKSVAVNCSADIQIPNIDIVFVLDVTGSMDSKVSNVRKIDALQDAVMRFYDEIANRVGAAGANRVRYGFVPYSQTVNVSGLFTSTSTTPAGIANGEAPLTHIADSMSVESRVANFVNVSETTIQNDNSEAAFQFDQTFSSSRTASREPFSASSSNATAISKDQCNDYVVNSAFSDGGTYYGLYPSNPADAPVLYADTSSSTSASVNIPNRTTFWKITFSKVSGSDNNRDANCTRRVRWTKQKKVTTTRKEFENYTYQPVTLSSAGFKAGGTVWYVTRVQDDYEPTQTGSFDMVTMAGWPVSNDLEYGSTRWDGCIEERDTVAQSSFTPIPSGAYDLNSLLGGTSAQTRWRPIMDNLTWNRGQVANRTTTDWNEDRPDYNCPSASIRNLRNWTEAAFDDYVATLDPPVGYTYLDVGMIWGLRLIAPQGIWGSRNLTGVNGGQIARHLIFLTDGQPVSEADTYSSYGVERMSRRITGTSSISNAASRHTTRFQALCDSMRGTVTIWTIAFDTPDGNILTNCADPGRDKTASNAASLNSVFTEIANDISDLRLIQ